jgi:hypothetical protein
MKSKGAFSFLVSLTSLARGGEGKSVVNQTDAVRGRQILNSRAERLQQLWRVSNAIDTNVALQKRVSFSSTFPGVLSRDCLGKLIV